jgi:hypothetical protein
VTQPPGPLISTDIARQSTLLSVFGELLAAIQGLSNQIGILMTQDATTAAEAADIDAKVGLTNTAMGSVQALLVALQQELATGTALSPATVEALQQAQTDMDALAASAQADVATDTPAPPAPAPGT